MQKLIFNILIIMLVSVSSHAGFSEINLSNANGGIDPQELLGKLKSYKVLIVNSDIGDEPLFINDRFQSFTRLLKSKGFVENADYEVVSTDVDDNPDFSAVDVVKAIRDSQKSVLIWSSSKASADVLAALLGHEELQAKVKGFISIQGTVGGVLKAKEAKRPVAVETNVRAEKMPLIQALRFLVDYIYSFSSSYTESMYSLNPESRKKYLRNHDRGLRQLSKNVPTLCVSRKGKIEYSIVPYSTQLILSPLDLISVSKEELALKLFAHFLYLNGNS